MKKKFGIIVVALLILDILDGDFVHVSVLDIVKLVLYAVCLFMLWKSGGDE